LAGREVTAASTSVRGFTGSDLVGRRVEKVEALGKHLVVRFQDGALLHTELRMTGSWDLYMAGAPWRRPASQASLSLECGERVAVCFNAPVVELLRPGGQPVHPAGHELGTDTLAQASGAARTRAHAVYRRPARPCPRCGTPLASQPQGEQASIVYWCPVCQPS
jgi:formamidopyrimidine-DNA glycosylase